MAIAPGTRIGIYEIAALIGEGGMGQVYRARDTKLNRDVALKVLPDFFADDPDRLARFQREAQVLASLNHPGIAHIHGLEESGSVRALVMEMVEGEDLTQRISSGPMPIDEALLIAKQIAEALEAASEQGIIHRDLKPANIRVRPDGTVKVLDFGLAKALEQPGRSAGDAANSPTLSALATQAGSIMGTAAYMAPEQAKGKLVDRRADIWAFGVVLFEMLTGRQLYTGETVAETLARVIEREPDFTALPHTTPPSIRTLLARSLTKDPRARLQAIGEARITIERAIAHPKDEGTGRDIARPRQRRAWPWVAAAVLATAAAAALIAGMSRQPPPAPALLRLSAELGADISLVPLTTLAVSPDGLTLAFVGERAGVTELYVRRLGGLQATALAGTAGARDPFYEPDGQWIGFFADGKLKKIPVTGGEAVTLCNAPSPFGGSWGEDGRITFGYALGVRQGGLQRVSDKGGTPEPLTTVEQGDSAHRWPQVLPGNAAVLYTAVGGGGSDRTSTPSLDEASLILQPLPAGPPQTLLRGGYHGRYLSSGHLAYIRNGTLFAVPFDIDRMAIIGEAVPAVEGLAAVGTGSAQYAVSSMGTLVYRPQSSNSDAPILWMDQNGSTAPLRPTPSDWSNPSFSPDGTRLAVDIFDERQGDVWIYEWTSGRFTRLTNAASSNESFPVWTPDGRRIVFASTRGDNATLNLYWQRADGSGEAERLTDGPNAQLPGAWHSSGKYLVFQENVPQAGLDIFILWMEGDEASGWKPGTITPFVNTAFLEAAPTFSPDGHWIAYHSNESGSQQVYVQPFPGPGAKSLISTGGGASPLWSGPRRELFYRNPANQIMVVPYNVEGDTFRPGKPRLWTEQPMRPSTRQRRFNIHPNGERFAVAIPTESQIEARRDHMVFVLNFHDELRRIAPTSR